MLNLFRRLRRVLSRARRDLGLEFLRRRLFGVADGSMVSVDGLTLHVTDGVNAYMQYKDEFLLRNYAFESIRPAPVVIDGGANIGMFTLATLRDHPDARITAFEPDPSVRAMLQENLDRNGAREVTIVEAALGSAEGELTFTPDGRSGGTLGGEGTLRVRVLPLSRYLDGEVDFLKLNIEGAELDVIQEVATAGRLRRVRSMVIEYHGWAQAPQRLGSLLQLLDANGFRYMLHDLDDQTNPRTKPPFAPPGTEPWFALVYAWRVER
jgi:FkbM family methyltransferase